MATQKRNLRLIIVMDGLEVDVLAVGDADCILVTKWTKGKPQRILIDGGRGQHAPMIKRFLVSQGAARIDHLVSTHPDADHAEGLTRLVKDSELTFGRAWMHIPSFTPTRENSGRALSVRLRRRKPDCCLLH